jgi:hypothetical protein
MTFASQLASAFTPIAAVYDQASITQALSVGQSAVENYCNQTFDLVTNDVVFIDPAGCSQANMAWPWFTGYEPSPAGLMRYRYAMLPQVPVANVEMVQALLPPQSPGVGLVWTTLINWSFVSDTGLIYDTTGQPGTQWNLGASWPWLPGSLQVNYDHGYAVIPQDLINVAIRLAQQYLENPVLQLQRRVGDIEDRFSGSAGIPIHELDRRILDRYTDIGIA